MAFFKHTAVKRQPFPVGLCIVAVGVDAAPRNGKAQGLKAHLCKQGNILFVMVVKINSYQLHIVFCGCFRPRAFDPVRKDILDGKSFAVLLVSTLALARPRPPSFQPPSHWLAAIAPPHKKFSGSDIFFSFLSAPEYSPPCNLQNGEFPAGIVSFSAGPFQSQTQGQAPAKHQRQPPCRWHPGRNTRQSAGTPGRGSPRRRTA